MLFYVVGNIVFWEFIHKEHDDRPYQKNIAFVINKSELCKKQSVQSRKRLRCFFVGCGASCFWTCSEQRLRRLTESKEHCLCC